MAESADVRPRGLLVTRNFPPLVGGMERVNQKLLAELAEDWQVSLCGPQGCARSAPEAASVAETALKPLPIFLLGSSWRAWRLARRERPRLVLAGSGLAAPMAWLAARSVGARLAVYLHGLDVIAPSWIYQRFWLPFIRACDIVLVNSENTGRLARGRGVPPARIFVLHPGVELPELDAAAGRRFRERLDLGQRRLLLSVGRFTRRKGLAEFVAGALPAVVAAHPDVLLVVIGEEASDALHGASGSERERVLGVARDAGVDANLRFLGRCDEETLRAAYQAADCHVFPVLALPGDVEGFGMVAVESAAHGLATVAFAVGGVPEAVSEGVSGHCVEAGDYPAMSDRIISLLDRADAQKRDDSERGRLFAAGFAWPVFGKRLRELVGPASGSNSTARSAT
jgi:phosphatidylinositol alpha-1,6-mannosyltransferase